MTILTAMIVFSVLFEQGTEKLEEATPESLEPVLTSLFSELTLLGFIGLSLFLMDKIEFVKVDLSVGLFGEEGAVGELCEAVHMALFMVMVLFLSTVIGLIKVGGKAVDQWNEWEGRPIISTSSSPGSFFSTSHSRCDLTSQAMFLMKKGWKNNITRFARGTMGSKVS